MTPEGRLGPSAVASVAVDVGADRGALVVRVPLSLDGAELEIRPRASQWVGTHTSIRRRDVSGVPQAAAIFGTLSAGSYQLRLRGGPLDRVLDVEVPPGRVTEVEWPEFSPTAKILDER